MDGARRAKLSIARRASDGPADPNDFATGVGECLRKARQDRGWTQAELAEAAGLSANYVARLERGELGPSLYVAFHLAEALGTHIETLLAANASPRRTGKRRIDGRS